MCQYMRFLFCFKLDLNLYNIIDYLITRDLIFRKVPNQA